MLLITSKQGYFLRSEMETTHPIEGYFSSEFPAICNHLGIMAACSGKMLTILVIFCVFFWKNDPLHYNFKNSVLKVFIASPIDVLCSNFVKFGQREIGEIVCYLSDKKISLGTPAVATAWIAPKICQDQPPTMYPDFSRFHPNRFTFGRVIAERVKTAKTCCKVNPIFG